MSTQSQLDTYGYGSMRIALGSVHKPNEKKLKSGFAPNYVHSFDACLLKKAFQKWRKPVVTIHDCIAVLPNDMDEAQERIRRAMIHVCQGEPLAKLAECFEMTPEFFPRLKPGEGEIN